jgi:hypothetical protein
MVKRSFVMLTDEIRLRAERQIKNAAAYKQTKAAGYNVVSLGLPSYDSQEDHDLYHPEQAGQDFRQENEFVVEVLKGLRTNGVPAELVSIKYADYATWLNGRKNTTEARATYSGFLVAESDRRRAKS